MSVDYLAPLDLRAVEEKLNTSYIGRRVHYFRSVSSTNDVAKELAVAGAPEGTLVIADVQTAGRGRLGRMWLSPPNANLLMSLVFYPQLAPNQAQRLTMICSLAIIDALAQVTGLQAAVKWPNDVLLAGKKAAGILTEAGLHGEKLAYLIVGIGLNVNLWAEQLPEELRSISTSVAQELGHPIPREPLLCALLAAIESRYERLKAGEVPLAEWSARLATLGRRVRVSDSGGFLEGWAEGVDVDGALLLRLDDGTLRRILAGDVTLR